VPAAIDESIKRKVIQQWITGESRDKIAAENNIGNGSVSSIIANYKDGLDSSEFDSIRQLALEIRKQQLNWSDLAPHIRLYNFFIGTGASEEKVESFITNVSSADISPEKVIELVNQLHEISKTESIPLDQVPGYIKEKLEEKQKIDDEIKQADAILEGKNVSIEAINEHIQLNEELSKYGLSTKDIHKLLNLLVAAKEYRYSPGKIVAKLRSIKMLENKEKRLKNSCEMLSKKEAKYKEIIPLAQKIVAMNIDINELLVFDNAVQEISKQYSLPPSVAAFRLFNEIKDYNKIGGIKREISRLSQQLIVVDGICTNRNKSMRAVLNLQSRGISEDRILYLNDLLEKNVYNIDMKSTVELG
jgi:hypothetical protein